MPKFPSHLVTKRIQKEILADAAQLATETLPITLPAEEALRPLPRGTMLALKFDRERQKRDWLRVAFVDRNEPMTDFTFRIGYAAACCMLPVTKLILAYSISPQFCAPFRNMVKSGLRQEKVELWVLEVAKLADLSYQIGPHLWELNSAMLEAARLSETPRGTAH